LEKFVIVRTPNQQDETCLIISGTGDLFPVASVSISSDTISYLSKPGTNIALKNSRTILRLDRLSSPHGGEASAE